MQAFSEGALLGQLHGEAWHTWDFFGRSAAVGTGTLRPGKRLSQVVCAKNRYI